MEIRFKTLAELQQEVGQRGGVASPIPDPRTRRVGVVMGDDYLYVPMVSLTRAQLNVVAAGGDVFSDVMDLSAEIAAGERASTPIRATSR